MAVYNFNAGPAALPLPVLKKAQEELVNFRGSGMSIMEMSHRSKAYDEVHNQAIQLLKEVMEIPDTHEVLFLQGGASLQFAMVPMNFLHSGQKAGYVLTGSWSEKAKKEADSIGQTEVAGSSKENLYRHIPSNDELQLSDEFAYLHVTSNNTIYGTQWHEFPHLSVPLIADMSSDILSRKIDVSQFSLVYAGAQKNLGPSGVTVVIAEKKLLENANKDIPKILSYQTHSSSNSLYNTPPTYSIYMLSLVLEWSKEHGGLDGLQKQNEKKADLIYQCLDEHSEFYLPHSRKDSRSLMNVTFNLQNEDLTKAFLKEASERGFTGLNGHRSIGGCRASIYNAVPMESCEALVGFMEEFRKKH
ncbi:3-phosphoserine/phosphohydroxythreonine transaminase [Metabacillus sp. RGM 3146]|uniref:3-phosphoserine/phosphohydroxythreonine transaminase n=1 Tax=Metabacillus sp. RGM 3146 TaxID=3401092 RepID=UPI003B9B92B2